MGNWILYFGNKPFNSQWNWHHEVQYRNYDAIGDLEQLLLRTGIGYFRYFLAITVALNKTQMEDGTLYLSSYDEIFLQTEGSIFDRNRLYGALGYRINSALRFELGYMNQFFSEGGSDQINVVTFVNF